MPREEGHQEIFGAAHLGAAIGLLVLNPEHLEVGHELMDALQTFIELLHGGCI